MAERQETRNSRTVRVAEAFSARELVQQEYRQLAFWGSVLSSALIVLFLTTVVTAGGTALLLFLALIARGIVAVARVYYRVVYRME